ncbi:MAG: DUF3052 family protein [Phycisphaerae bacterium]|nr:DUF3052 family protein [Phycisphaerae bacterium]
MAMESACKLQVGRDRYEGQVRMEADHIDFSGSTKFRFRLAEITNPRRDGDIIRFNFHGSPVGLTLNPLRATDQWIDYMQHPQTLADKLGVVDGLVLKIVNIEDVELSRSLSARKIQIQTNGDGSCDMVMLGVDRASDLRQLGGLTDELHEDGSIWVVMPKSVRTVTKSNVLAAAKEAGMTNVEVVDFSENRAAYKMIRPETLRKQRAEIARGARSTPVKA